MKLVESQRPWYSFRYIRLMASVVILIVTAASSATAQTMEERLQALEKRMDDTEQLSKENSTVRKYSPQIHGILRAKFEHQPEMGAGRFEVRNARINFSGSLPLKSEYKLEVDLCDESSIKMKDAWVRLTPWRTLRLSVGQQRLPFSIDAHRNPSDQFFANRSFIAKQVGDMRDVGFLVGYTFREDAKKRTYAIIDGGIFNGSNIDNQKNAWHSDVNYSARLQVFPVKGLAVVSSVQHTAIADREAHYTSYDIGSFYEISGLHIEAEFLHKVYDNNAFDECNAVNAMAMYDQKLRKSKYFESITYLMRYDYMGDHSNGKSGFEENELGEATSRLKITDYERHRMTLGMTFNVRNPYFPTDVRFNYERYWYPHGGAKESEKDKIVAELVVKF